MFPDRQAGLPSLALGQLRRDELVRRLHLGASRREGRSLSAAESWGGGFSTKGHISQVGRCMTLRVVHSRKKRVRTLQSSPRDFAAHSIADQPNPRIPAALRKKARLARK